MMLNKKSATYLSSSTDKLGCTLLSKRDKPNQHGWLSDLWQGDAKHSNGRLFRFLTGSPYRIDKQYSVGLRAVTVRAIRAEGGIHTQTVTAKKLQQPYTGPLQPFFRNKKPQVPYLQTLVFLPHLSSSSDLRILSSTQPSQD